VVVLVFMTPSGSVSQTLNRKPADRSGSASGSAQGGNAGVYLAICDQTRWRIWVVTASGIGT
jgi:hypothetical protein